MVASDSLVHQNQLSKILFPALLELLDKAKVSLKDLDYIAVARGPGSYTGTRIGAIIAKSLAFALTIPLIGFDSSNNLSAEELAKAVHQRFQNGEYSEKAHVDLIYK